CAAECLGSFAHRSSHHGTAIRGNAATDVATCGGVAETGEDRDDPHLARSPCTASSRANVDKIYDRDLRRNRGATDSVGRPAGSHRAASVDGLRNHVHQWEGTKSAGCD